MRNRLHPVLLSVLTAALCLPAAANTILFDFDSGSPPLSTGMGLPLSQTAGGATATFTGRFSVQSHDTTFYNLPNFSGNYLDPSDVYSPPLTVSFDRVLIGLSFDFATADFGLDTNTTLQLTAYLNSTFNPAVGSTTSQAVGEGWGLGTLTFQSNAAFNLVEVVILPGAGSDFLADNFQATTFSDGGGTIPEPATAAYLGLGFVALAGLARRRKWL
ncbi:MAG TPA: PEP-CTERM sorting domain-containing protein [Bryobacteraceae bacterium]|nr:PEP-CTERM sorting domain-containing protein [Bryobacteraceae bacterium]